MGSAGSVAGRAQQRKCPVTRPPVQKKNTGSKRCSRAIVRAGPLSPLQAARFTNGAKAKRPQLTCGRMLGRQRR